MSMAKKCDLCGVLYDAKKVYSESGKPNGISLERMYNDSNQLSKTLHTWDLCPDCMNAINKTIEERKALYK